MDWYAFEVGQSDTFAALLKGLIRASEVAHGRFKTNIAKDGRTSCYVSEKTGDGEKMEVNPSLSIIKTCERLQKYCVVFVVKSKPDEMRTQKSPDLQVALEVERSVERVTQDLIDRFGRLSLKGVPFKTYINTPVVLMEELQSALSKVDGLILPTDTQNKI